MAWGYWSASAVQPDRGRSPRRGHQNMPPSCTTTNVPVIDDTRQQQLSYQTSIASASTCSPYPGAANMNGHMFQPAMLPDGAVIPTDLPLQYMQQERETFESDNSVTHQFVRRPSLEMMGSTSGIIGNQNALAAVLCGGRSHGGSLSAGSTLTRRSSSRHGPHHSSGSTGSSTSYHPAIEGGAGSVGSCGAPVEYAVPHSYHHHYHQTSSTSIAPHASSSSINYDCMSMNAMTNEMDAQRYHHHHHHHHVRQSVSGSDDDDDDDESEPGYASVFPNVPAAPGMPCQGEDRSIYRRGARRWKKTYCVNGHVFEPRRFNRKAFCAYCQDRIWGLGRQGFKCKTCKLLVHKKCHKLVQISCNTNGLHDPVSRSGSDHNGEGADSSLRQSTTGTPSNEVCRPFPVQPPDLTSGHRGESIPVDGTVANVDSLEPGTQRQYSLDDFELIRVIGRGSYAKVYMVELKKTRVVYAMKVIKKSCFNDEEDIDWVQTEKHVFETASNHPFLVGLHSCFQTASRLFFVIEFVRGGDLMFHMQRQRRLPEEHARFYAAEISLALNFLHEKGIIYRDLKLDNVLLDHEGHIKLTDYGMCKEGVRPGDTTSTFCGTPNYIAPEILRGEDYGFSVDWWALGVLLYEMLAGRSPFDLAGASDNPDQNTEDYLFQVILEKTIRVPRALSVKASSVLKGFLNKNPADRLGCRGENAFLEIVNHNFFKSIDWELLEQKQVPTPYKPRMESDRDLANFPPEFTGEPVQLTPDDPSIIEKIDQSEFEGFEYVNPLLMSIEDCV